MSENTPNTGSSASATPAPAATPSPGVSPAPDVGAVTAASSLPDPDPPLIVIEPKASSLPDPDPTLIVHVKRVEDIDLDKLDR